MSATGPRRGALGRVGRIVPRVLAAALVVFVLAELLARALVPPLPPIYSVHPYAGFVWSPDLSIEYRARRGEGDLMTLRTDRWGFRGDSLGTVEKPAGTRRVFFLGGSVFAGVDLPEPETIPGRCESLLQARAPAGTRVACVNASLSGSNLEKDVSDFLHRALPFEPDAVVVYTGLNDVLDSVDPRFDPTHYSERTAEPDRLRRWLARHLRLAQWAGWRRLAQGHNPFLERPPLEPELGPASQATKNPQPWDPEPGFRSWRRYLGTLEAVARENGVKLVLVTQGSLWREGEVPAAERALLRFCWRYGDRAPLPELARVHHRYMDAVRDLARTRGVALVDGEAVLPKTAELFVDDVHLTPRGVSLLSGAIAEALGAGAP